MYLTKTQTQQLLASLTRKVSEGEESIGLILKGRKLKVVSGATHLRVKHLRENLFSEMLSRRQVILRTEGKSFLQQLALRSGRKVNEQFVSDLKAAHASLVKMGVLWENPDTIWRIKGDAALPSSGPDIVVDIARPSFIRPLKVVGRRKKRKPATFPHRSKIALALFAYVVQHGDEIDASRHNGTMPPVYGDLADHFKIPAEDRAIPHLQARTLWNNEVNWCRDRCVKLKLFLPVLESGVGIWKITPGKTIEDAKRLLKVP